MAHKLAINVVPIIHYHKGHPPSATGSSERHTFHLLHTQLHPEIVAFVAVHAFSEEYLEILGCTAPGLDSLGAPLSRPFTWWHRVCTSPAS